MFLTILFSIFVILLDSYYWGIFRRVFLGNNATGDIQGEVYFEGRIAGLQSHSDDLNLGPGRWSLYTGRHSKLIITSQYIYFDKTKFSYQFKLAIGQINKVCFNNALLGFDAVIIHFQERNTNCFVKIWFFSGQGKVIKAALSRTNIQNGV